MERHTKRNPSRLETVIDQRSAVKTGALRNLPITILPGVACERTYMDYRCRRTVGMNRRLSSFS